MEEWKNENSSRIESKRGHEWLGDDTEVEPCTKKQAKDALSDIELESCANKHELESSCTKKQTNDALSDTELESCANKQVKEASNDEIFSEVSNRNLSPTDNACSIQTISSQLVELVSNNQVVSGENSSTCSRNLSIEESLNEEEESKNDTSGAVSTSLFVCEIPKDFSSTGIRKFTFKFSKRKKDYDNQLSAIAVGSGSDGISQWNHSASDDMNTEISSYGKVVDESSKTFLRQPNMDLKMSKKVLPDSYPTTIKKLLSTGILEGGRVKYVTTSQEYVYQIFTTCDDLLLKKQFCYILGQHRITFVLDEEMSRDDECRETLQGFTNNGKLSEGYLMLARDIEVMEPKSSKDIYKDKLMTVPSEASGGGSSRNWVFKNKAHGKASAAASLALLNSEAGAAIGCSFD